MRIKQKINVATHTKSVIRNVRGNYHDLDIQKHARYLP